MLFDTHAHLNDDAFISDLEETVNRAREVCGVKLINIVDLMIKVYRVLQKLCVEIYDEMYLTVFNPVEAADFTEEKK